MIGSFKKAKSEEPGSKEFKTDIQDALVYGGLMAHFVGDASQPYHNTIDHDGYAAGEGGIHSYFETAAPTSRLPPWSLDVYDQVPDAYRAVLKKIEVRRRLRMRETRGGLPHARAERAGSGARAGRAQG